MNNIINIQGVECFEKDNIVYLKLETVARGLGFTETSKSGNECVRWRTVRKYLNDLMASQQVATLGLEVEKDGLPEFIPENVFYRLAMKAKNDVAERFQAKIADEVIPSIRRTGRYDIKESYAINDPIERAKRWIEEEQERQRLLQENNEMKPKVKFANKLLKSEQNIKIRDMAKILCDNDILIGEKKLFKLLRNSKVLMKNNIPYQKYINDGYFVVKETAFDIDNASDIDNKTYIRFTTLVTTKGQEWIIKNIKKMMGF